VLSLKNLSNKINSFKAIKVANLFGKALNYKARSEANSRKDAIASWSVL